MEREWQDCCLTFRVLDEPLCVTDVTSLEKTKSQLRFTKTQLHQQRKNKGIDSMIQSTETNGQTENRESEKMMKSDGQRTSIQVDLGT